MTASPSEPAPPPPSRITSIDALRGFVMFTMIFVNCLHSAGKIVPDWMSHFSDRHEHGSGMTFVDLVFPAFLFCVGMSLPFALGSRLAKGEPIGKIILHILTRTLALLFLGILMVNGKPDSDAMGWSGNLWEILLYLFAIFAFCSISPRGQKPNSAKISRIWTLALRVIGFAGLLYLMFAFRGENGHRIIKLSPFSIHTSWWGILGLIGWSYLVASLVFLVFRTNRTAILGCVALLLCLYPADKRDAFEHIWPGFFPDLGVDVGAHSVIAVAGLLLGSILVTPDKSSPRARLNFTLLFIAGCAAAALLLNGLYGISKNDATPSWCLWSCAITAALWLKFYYLCDIAPVPTIARPLAVAGQNVFLAYLLSEMIPSFASLTGPHLAGAIAISLASAFVILFLTARLNRRGFRLKL